MNQKKGYSQKDKIDLSNRFTVGTPARARPFTFEDKQKLKKVIENAAVVSFAREDFFENWLRNSNIDEEIRRRILFKIDGKDASVSANFLVDTASYYGRNDRESGHTVLSTLLESLIPDLAAEDRDFVSRVAADEKQRLQERGSQGENTNKRLASESVVPAEPELSQVRRSTIWLTGEYDEEVSKIGRDTDELVEYIKDFQKDIPLGVEGYSYFYHHSRFFKEIQEVLLEHAWDSEQDDRKFLQDIYKKVVKIPEPHSLMGWPKAPEELDGFLRFLETFKEEVEGVFPEYAPPAPMTEDRLQPYRTAMTAIRGNLKDVITSSERLKDIFKNFVEAGVDELKEKSEEIKKTIGYVEQAQKKLRAPATQG